jgi:hypothetical protein
LSQSYSQSQTYLGLIAGGHGASSYIEHTLYNVNLRSTYIPGWHGGIQFKYFNPINPRLKINSGIQGGVILSRKGWAQDFILHPRTTTKLDYLTIPIEGVVYFGNESNRYFLSLGGFADFLINHNTPETLFQELIIEDYYTYDPDRDKSFGYGLSIGLGYFRNGQIGTWEVSAYFNYAISNFIGTERPADEVPDLSNLFELGLRVGYFIPLNW